MSTQMWSSFPVTSHLFMSQSCYLSRVMLLVLLSRQTQRLHSPLLCLYSSQSLLFLWSPSPGTQALRPPCPCPASLLFLCNQPSLPSPSTGITSNAYLLLTPALRDAAPASPWLLIKPRFLPPTSAPSSSQSSSLLAPTTGFSPFLQLLTTPPCHILSSGLTPHLCFQSSLLSPLLGTAHCCQHRQEHDAERLSEEFSYTPGPSRWRYELRSARCG